MSLTELPGYTGIFFDWDNPIYLPVWNERARRLNELRDPAMLAASKAWYRHHIDDFVNDWGVTIDPRDPRKPAIMPFLLMPKQREWLRWMNERWERQEDGVTEKSRDCGLSWLAMSFAVSMCLMWENVSFGFGSEKEDKVDRTGDPDCLFYKGRMFLQYLPECFRGAWELKKNSAHMRLAFPLSGSSITGEAGDNIGRGGRKTVYFVDESAHVEHPKLIDASLVANTNCRIDISSVNGSANSFYDRAHNPNIPKFTFHWRDDTRKTEEWAKKKQGKTDPIVWAAEYEINYAASVDGVIIPQEWVQAAVDAHKKLGIEPSGAHDSAFDVADQGKDKNALAARHGMLLNFIESWRGVGSDIYKSTEKVFMLCDRLDLDGFAFDEDGMGAGVRGDAAKINELRKEKGMRLMRVVSFRGSSGVLDPERKVRGTNRTNKDFFENRKAQAWWDLRQTFLNTYRAVSGQDYEPNDLISIDSTLAERARLCIELSQPVWEPSKTGKMMVNKTPDEVPSPNLADSVMMLFARRRPAVAIHPSLLERLANGS